MLQHLDVRRLLDELRSLPAENEWVEFKEAKNTFHSNELGVYFSALSNEANLQNKPFGWLIFGVEDKAKKIVGTNFRSNRSSLDNLKHEISVNTSAGLSFVEIHELLFPEGRVIMFQIPAAWKGIPTAWKGHYYGRSGESLESLSLHEMERIRNQVILEDWSAGICEEATIRDLDERAIQRAREEFKNKNVRLAKDVDNWSDETFLNKAKLTIRGHLTRAALLLLGKSESEYFLAPAVGK